MSTTSREDQLSDKEATKRMEDAIRRALSTPHKPNQAFVGKKAKPDSAKVRKPRSNTKGT
jgi:hypothetical protein